MKFINKKTNEINEVYSIEVVDSKVHIKFTEYGKEYIYSEDNVEIFNKDIEKKDKTQFKIYKFLKECYRCHKETVIYTYILFDDDTNEDVVYPWDKKRLLKNQDIFAHLQDPSIEYYGLKVIGFDKQLDTEIMKKYPDNIKVEYSNIKKKEYPMNICNHCNAKQGWYYIYRYVNQEIAEMRDIEIVK